MHTHTHTHTTINTKVDRQQEGNPSDAVYDVNMDMQKCGAYDVVQLSRQRVIVNDNIAYGEIGVGVQTE